MIPRLFLRYSRWGAGEVVRPKRGVANLFAVEPGEAYWGALEPFSGMIDLATPESFQASIGNLPVKLRLVYAAHFCASEVCRGGFMQFFLNTTGVLAPEAVEGFRAIGQPSLAAVVGEAMSLFGLPYVRDRGERRKIVDGLPQKPSFKRLEYSFYSRLRTEAGGFERAADQYVATLGSGRTRNLSQKVAAGRQAPMDTAAALRHELLNLKAEITGMRDRMAAIASGQSNELCS